ncbi:CoA transferase [Aeromicrobium sp. YIM 150415]|nr:CoA transferase [Aeromicrobium sp. YIM 150415]
MASGLRVTTLGLGLAPMVVAKHFAELGANVERVRPSCPDRGEDYPAFAYWSSLMTEVPRHAVEQSVAGADVCILGGETDPAARWRFDAAKLAETHPRLVVIEIASDLVDGESDVGNELLAQARNGMVFEQFADRPYVHGLRPATYGAALNAIVGGWAALVERARSGCGQLVRTTYTHGLASLFNALWMTTARSDSPLQVYPPRDVQQLIFPTADGCHVQLTLGDVGAVARLEKILRLGGDVDASPGGRAAAGKGPRRYFADYDRLAPAVAAWESGTLVDELRRQRIGVELVRGPGDCWDEQQVVENDCLVEHGGYQYVGPSFSVLRRGGGRPRPEITCVEGPVGAPLEGIRVVDFGAFVSGPLGARLLADLGAEVVHVEPLDAAGSLTSHRQLVVANRGKRSIMVDLKSRDGRDVAERLIRRSDVVLHNFRVGVAERLGLGEADVRAINPRAVTVRTSAFGMAGPKRSETGFDMLIQAYTGVERRAGGPGGQPLWVRTITVDYVSGLLGAAAALAALYVRAVRGGVVEAQVDLLRAGLFLLTDIRRAPDGDVEQGPALDHDRMGFGASERLYETADGWVAIAAVDGEMFERLLGVLDIDAEGSGNADVGRIASRLRALTSSEALSRVRGAGVWAEPCIEDGWSRLRDSVPARTAGLVLHVDDEAHGPVTGWFGAPFVLGRYRLPALPRRSAPAQGVDTCRILREIGYSAEEIEVLETSGVVRSAA